MIEFGNSDSLVRVLADSASGSLAVPGAAAGLHRTGWGDNEYSLVMSHGGDK